jgi:hypothetical protein
VQSVSSFRSYQEIELIDFSTQAMSAAPILFEPLFYEGSQEIYLGSIVYHNNPIKITNTEHKLIWPDQKHKHLDIVLSIRTGNPGNREIRDMTPSRPLKPGQLSFLKTIWTVGYDHISNSLSSERIWEDWYDTKNPPSNHQGRYHRLSPTLDPKFTVDSVRDLEECRKQAHDEMNKDKMSKTIHGIANRLIASSFFFHQTKEQMDLCTGT